MTDRGTIVVATSIPPALSRLDAGKESGAAYQRLCINSWLDCGFRVLSVNDRSDIAKLAPLHPNVTFVPTDRNASAFTGRNNPFVADLLGALLDTAAPVLGIVNSDILFEPTSLWEKQLPGMVGHSVVSLQRYDTHSLNDGALRRFYWGYDVFFFDRPMALAMADSAGPFAMGMPWWDYWVPAATVFARRRFQIVGRPLALHLVHPRGYDDGSTATFETAFAEFVVSAAAKWSDPLSSDLTGLVRLCREWLDRKNENKKDLLFSGQTFETFAESIAPWRRALLENIISLNGVETSVQPSSHPSSGTRHANPAFGNLDSRLRAGSALDGARHFESTGQREEAKRMFQTALDLIPSDFGALSDFGEFLCRFGDPLEACTVLERARAQRPASAKVLNDFAYALRAAGRREDAIANFRQALTADPEFLDAYYNLAITLFEAGQPNDALACLDAALMKWPSAADIVQLRQHFSARAR